MIGLIFFAQFARHKPGLNMIALFSFTTVSGLTLGPLLYAVGPSIATQAFALTAITFGGLTMYVVFSRISALCLFLMVGLITVVIGSLLNMFLFQSPMMHFMMSGVGVILFVDSSFMIHQTSCVTSRRTSTPQHSSLFGHLEPLHALLSILGLSEIDGIECDGCSGNPANWITSGRTGCGIYDLGSYGQGVCS